MAFKVVNFFLKRGLFFLGGPGFFVIWRGGGGGAGHWGVETGYKWSDKGCLGVEGLNFWFIVFFIPRHFVGSGGTRGYSYFFIIFFSPTFIPKLGGRGGGGCLFSFTVLHTFFVFYFGQTLDGLRGGEPVYFFKVSPKNILEKNSYFLYNLSAIHVFLYFSFIISSVNFFL